MLGGVLSMGRRWAESRFTEEVIVGLYEDGTDEVTGDPTRVLVEEHYSGPGQIKGTSLNVSEREGAGQVVATSEPVLKLPVADHMVRTGDEVQVVSSKVDSSLPSRTFTIKGRPQPGQVTAHRFTLKEQS